MVIGFCKSRRLEPVHRTALLAVFAAWINMDRGEENTPFGDAHITRKFDQPLPRFPGNVSIEGTSRQMGTEWTVPQKLIANQNSGIRLPLPALYPAIVAFRSMV